MDYQKILLRAWNILWNYRTLWIFGILLALTSVATAGGGGGSGSGGRGGSSNLRLPVAIQVAGDLPGLSRLFSQGFPPGDEILLGVVISFILVGLLLGIFFAIAHFVSQAALIRMVDRYERHGDKVTWQTGVRLGWSRAAWRLFLINLFIFLPLIAIFMVLFTLAALPVMIGGQMRGDPPVISLIASGLLVMLLVLLGMTVVLALSLLLEPVRRECVLHGFGVIASIRAGWQLVQRRFKEVFLLWLILLAIRIGIGLVLIPVAVAFLGAGLLVGGGAAAILFLLVRLVVDVTAGWVTAAAAGISLAVLIVAVPLLFLGGLRETYFSSVWTLAYREILPVPESDEALAAES